METSQQIFDKFTNNGRAVTPMSIIQAIEYAQGCGLAVRPAVKWYAGRMEETLKRNDHKGGWKRCDIQYLSMRLTQERKELTDAIASKDPERIINECTDVSNFSLMLTDKFGKNYGG